FLPEWRSAAARDFLQRSKNESLICPLDAVIRAPTMLIQYGRDAVCCVRVTQASPYETCLYQIPMQPAQRAIPCGIRCLFAVGRTIIIKEGMRCVREDVEIDRLAMLLERSFRGFHHIRRNAPIGFTEVAHQRYRDFAGDFVRRQFAHITIEDDTRT